VCCRDAWLEEELLKDGPVDYEVDDYGFYVNLWESKKALGVF